MMHQLIQLDVRAFMTLNSMHNPVLDVLFFMVTQLGNGWVIAPMLAAGIVLKYRKKWMRPVLVCTVALIGSGLINNLIKQSVDRARPLSYFESVKASEQKYTVHAPDQQLRGHSFPSGHTNTAFASAVLVVVFFGTRWWPVFILAVCTGYSRIYLGVHFPLDVCAGALSGCASALATVLLMNRLYRPASTLVSSGKT